MIKLITNVFKGWKNAIKKLMQHEQPLCRLEAIDLVKKIAIINCRYISTSIKISLAEIIYDQILISNLLSKQAAWIGYYCGINYRQSINNDRKKHNVIIPLMDENYEYMIVAIDRKGNLTYFDKTNNLNCVTTPLLILKTKDLLNKFSPIQAYYIGMLSGLSMDKNTIINKKTNKPNLSIVK